MNLQGKQLSLRPLETVSGAWFDSSSAYRYFAGRIKAARGNAAITVKVVFVGDSTLFGWQTDGQATAPAAFARELRRLEPTVKFQFIDRSIPGWGFVQFLGATSASYPSNSAIGSAAAAGTPGRDAWNVDTHEEANFRWPEGAASFTATTWGNIVKADAPDLLVPVLGFNDMIGGHLPIKSLRDDLAGLFTYVGGFATVPSVCLMTEHTGNPNFTTVTDQDKLRGMNGQIRQTARALDWGVWDVGRAYDRRVRGLDPLRFKMDTERYLYGFADATKWQADYFGSNPSRSPVSGAGTTGVTIDSTGLHAGAAIVRLARKLPCQAMATRFNLRKLGTDNDVAQITTGGARGGAGTITSEAQVIQLRNQGGVGKIDWVMDNSVLQTVNAPAPFPSNGTSNYWVEVLYDASQVYVWLHGNSAPNAPDATFLLAAHAPAYPCVGYSNLVGAPAVKITDVVVQLGKEEPFVTPDTTLLEMFGTGPLDDYLTNPVSLGGDGFATGLHPSTLGNHLIYDDPMNATLAAIRQAVAQDTISTPIALAAGSTAVTPAVGDNSTKVATTAWGVAFAAALAVNTAAVANVVWAGPGSGGAAVPSFRALVAGDIPALTSAKISDFDAQVRLSRLDQLAAPTADVSVNGHKLTNVGTPTLGTDAVNKTYADSLVTGLWDDRGVYDASVNTYPASGGSGTAGAVLKGDIWTVSVAGTLGGTVVQAGDLVRALVDAPGQTAGNWALAEHDLGYTPLSKDQNLAELASAPTALTNLGGTTVGKAMFTLASPGAVTFPRFNADNSVTARSAANFRTDLGLGTADSPTFAAVNAGTAAVTNTSGTVLSLGSTVDASSASPVVLSLGGTYSDTAGAKPKIRLYDNGSTFLGFGFSLNQFDYIAHSAGAHAFWSGALKSLLLTSAGNLVFPTDNTQDIGASGATRPRDFFLGRNAVVGGTLGVTGVATFTAAPVFTDASGSRTALGLGTMATQAANNVAITGGTAALTASSSITKSANASTALTVSNVNGGTAAIAYVSVTNDGSLGYLSINVTGTAYSNNGAYKTDCGVIDCGSAMSNGLSIVAQTLAMRLYVGGILDANLVAQLNAGNLTMTGDVKLGTAGNGLYVKEGTNATMGQGTLVGGTLTVNTTKVTASSRIFLGDQGGGVLANMGVIYEDSTARVNGTSFTVKSINVLDTSKFCWVLFEPA